MSGDIIKDKHFKQILYGVAVAVTQTLFCGACFYVGLFRTEFLEFIYLFSACWAGHLLFVVAAYSGFHKRLKFESLILPHMVWNGIWFLVSAYYLDRMRISVMMMFLLVMLIGSFRIKLSGFMLLAGIAIIGYGGVLYLLGQNHPETLFIATEFLQELMQWGAFSLVILFFAWMGADISGLRQALAAKNKALNEALRRISELATRDELTGLFNRRYISDVFKIQKGMADRGGHDFVLCYLDLDHFKQVNDTYGHSVGDEVLKVYAELAQSHVRSIDYCARFGGEEFVIILVKTEINGAHSVVDRIRHSIENYNFQTIAPGLKVTLSVGMSQYQSFERVEDALARADSALYRAKNAGRNRVVVADMPPRNMEVLHGVAVKPDKKA
ncbi:MAG: GGDEF domain-containing protein [Pseudomonadales bacterium]|nr:GGDEF domain-containing protein [Pseudomonadales bacterium]